MAEARIKFGESEYEVGDGISIGRTPDNAVSIPDDSNISRNHARIEKRDGAFFINDLGSSNGTAVNGIPVKAETPLGNGDYIILGNSSTLVFEIEGEDEMDDDDSAANESVIATETAVASGGSNRTLIAGAAGGLALALAVGAGALYMASGSACAATAKIVSPESGDTIMTETEIEVEAQNAGCVSKAVFTIDGVEFATVEDKPFTATIDPKDHPDLADGIDHNLSIALFDKEGNKIFQPAPVLLAFETREVEAPNANVAQTTNQNTQTIPTGKLPSLVEVQTMSNNLLKQVNSPYTLNNKDFVQEIQKRSAEYAQDGYFDRAAQYRDSINVAFVREQNLPAPLGFWLAMSRSKFNAAKQGSDEGLFRMTNEFVTANSYNGQCGTETLSDPSQNCAAKAASLYMKAIVFGVFEGDVLYGAAAFGKSSQDAAAWKATLPANRSDIGATVKTGPEREQIVRFIAAGIVAENPQKFGLKKDKPLAELYKVAM